MTDFDHMPRDPDNDDVPIEFQILAGEPSVTVVDEGVTMHGVLAIGPMFFGHLRRLREHFYDE